MDFTNADWEDYYGQEPCDNTHVGYRLRNGKWKFDKIESDLDKQILEIQRLNGRNTEIRLYKAVTV